MNIPIGFRFDPTDEELLRCFLYPRIVGEDPLPWDGITDRKVYGADAEPWKVFPDADDGSPYYWHTKVEGGYTKKSIYVFTNLIIKSEAIPNSKSNQKKNKDRASRIAGCGTWWGRTGPRKIERSDTGDIIGSWKMLTFQCSKYHEDLVGRWIMHEYSLNDATLKLMGAESKSTDLVLCKITKWIKIKTNEAKAEAEAVKYYSNNQQTSAPINHNHANNNNEAEAEAEAVQYYSNNLQTSAPINHNHVNNNEAEAEVEAEQYYSNNQTSAPINNYNNKRSVEIIDDCSNKLQKSTSPPPSSSSYSFDDLDLLLQVEEPFPIDDVDNINLEDLIDFDFCDVSLIN